MNIPKPLSTRHAVVQVLMPCELCDSTGMRDANGYMSACPACHGAPGRTTPTRVSIPDFLELLEQASAERTETRKASQ